jgi:hypothetical protein
VHFEIVLDGFDKFCDRIESAPSDGFVSDFSEESLDQVKPGAGRWNEVEDKSLVLLEPFLDVRVLVGSVVIEHEVEAQVFGRLPIDFL